MHVIALLKFAYFSAFSLQILSDRALTLYLILSYGFPCTYLEALLLQFLAKLLIVSKNGMLMANADLFITVRLNP